MPIEFFSAGRGRDRQADFERNRIAIRDRQRSGEIDRFQAAAEYLRLPDVGEFLNEETRESLKQLRGAGQELADIDVNIEGFKGDIRRETGILGALAARNLQRRGQRFGGAPTSGFFGGGAAFNTTATQVAMSRALGELAQQRATQRSQIFSREDAQSFRRFMEKLRFDQQKQLLELQAKLTAEDAWDVVGDILRIGADIAIGFAALGPVGAGIGAAAGFGVDIGGGRRGI